MTIMKSLKQFRKRHLSGDLVIASFAISDCKKSLNVEEAAQRSVLKIKNDGDTKNGREDTLPHAHHVPTSKNELVLMQHPMEPYEIDHPIRCPHPEHGVIQDGQTLKERAISTKRKGQLPFLTEREMQKLLWNHRTSSSDGGQIFSVASAPEALFLAFLS